MHRLKAVTLLIVIVTVTVLLAGLLPAAAQDDYQYTVVGGVDAPQEYADQTVEDFTFTNHSYRSLYPGGLEFRVTITPPEGVEYDRVTLFYQFEAGQKGRVAARPGDEPGEWIAIPYEARGLAPWHEIDAWWGVRGADELSVDTDPVHAVYYDATREWFRAESQDVLVYWYGMPSDLGRYVLDFMAGNHDRYVAGFGVTLPYRPLAIIFPPGPDWNEFKGDSSVDDTQLGFTGTINSQAGSTVQRVRTLEPAEIRKDCIWNPVDPDVEWQMEYVASTVTHEVAHLHQTELGISGPTWWVEGQATFFEPIEEYPLDQRLSTLAGLMDGPFPTFQGAGPGGGALTAAEDGCTHLIYDMGASFMRWLADTHGGMATYRAVVDEMEHGATLEDALFTVTGQTLLELENDWRVYLNIPPVSPEQLDPGLALDAAAEPAFAVDEQITLGATPFSQPMYSEPTERSAANGTCFANSVVTVLRNGNDGTLNWYEVDCMGMVGWMSQAQVGTP